MPAFLLPLLALAAGGAAGYSLSKDPGNFSGNPSFDIALQSSLAPGTVSPQRRGEAIAGGLQDNGLSGGSFKPHPIFNRPKRDMNPFNRILEGLDRVGDYGRRLEEQSQPTIQDIMEELERRGDPSRYMPNSDELRQQAIAAASAQYDPLIAALRQQMGAAQTRGQRNKVELGQMFGALSNDLMDDIPEVQQTFNQAQGDVDKQYKELQASIGNQYAQTQKEQEDMWKRLNIEAAAPEIAPEQARDRDFFTNLAASENQTQQASMDQEERGAVEFTRRGAELARVEGTQRQADLMSQLSEMLAAYEGQIGAHQAAKQQAITAGLGQLQQSAQQYAIQQSDRDMRNYMDVLNLGRTLRRDEYEMQQQNQPQLPSIVKSPADIAGRAMGMGLSPQDASQLQSIFMGTLNDPLVRSGIDPGTQLQMSDEALASQFVEAGRRAGLSPELLNALQIMALEYYR